MRENRRWHPRGQLLPWMSRPIETEDVITTTNITDKSRCIKEMNKGVLFFGEPTLRRTADFCNGVICLYQVINLYSKSELSGNAKKKKDWDDILVLFDEQLQLKSVRYTDTTCIKCSVLRSILHPLSQFQVAGRGTGGCPICHRAKGRVHP